MAAALASKVAIVTGAGGGLGKSIAASFLTAGAQLVLVDINLSYLSAAVTSLKGGENVLAVEGNVSSTQSVASIFQQAVQKFGTVDILVNNAGIMDDFSPVGDLSPALWDKVMGVNVTGPMLLSQQAVKHWLAKDKPGVILNVSSIGGLFGNRAGAAYTASKHALIGLTKNTAATYHKKKIRCNALCPGSMPTTNIHDAFRDGMHEENRNLAMLTMAMQPNLCETDDVAEVAVFLCSEKSKTCSGAVVTADAGWTAF